MPCRAVESPNFLHRFPFCLRSRREQRFLEHRGRIHSARYLKLMKKCSENNIDFGIGVKFSLLGEREDLGSKIRATNTKMTNFSIVKMISVHTEMCNKKSIFLKIYNKKFVRDL